LGGDFARSLLAIVIVIVIVIDSFSDYEHEQRRG